MAHCPVAPGMLGDYGHESATGDPVGRVFNSPGSVFDADRDHCLQIRLYFTDRNQSLDSRAGGRAVSNHAPRYNHFFLSRRKEKLTNHNNNSPHWLEQSHQ
ncbi:hypothetical protein BC828DRAFT_51005 [Blastocladiella britannica]|nr:hypothetical protein BC828DRAFT_51005 [Blastocladiella britannica]